MIELFKINKGVDNPMYHMCSSGRFHGIIIFRWFN